MEKTINPDTRRPYTITMIERLMHEIHFAVDPNLTSKEQVLYLPLLSVGTECGVCLFVIMLYNFVVSIICKSTVGSHLF